MDHVAALGSVDAAALPFLGPAVVAWITFGIGVMMYYFLIVARRPRPEKDRREPEHNPAPAPPSARPWAAPAPSRANLPAYEMEEFPEDRWGVLATPTASAPAERRSPRSGSAA